MRDRSKSSYSSRWGLGPKKGAVMSKTIIEMLTLEQPKRCGRYSPGHEVHWIPGIRFADEPRLPATIEVAAEGYLLVHWIGPTLRFYNHESSRIRRAIEIYGQKSVSINLQRLLLYIASEQKTALVFNLGSKPSQCQ